MIKKLLKLISETFWKFVFRQFEQWILQSFRQIWGFTLKKLKLGRDPPHHPCRQTAKKNFKASNWSRQ